MTFVSHWITVNKTKKGISVKTTLKKYIKWAGGPTAVSKKLALSRTTIWRWVHEGFPDTDFSGKTKYSKKLAKMCRDNGYLISTQKILKSGRP